MGGARTPRFQIGQSRIGVRPRQGAWTYKELNMQEYEAVVVSVAARGRWPYHEVRLVLKDVGGGHYENSVGCTIIRRSGPVRGTVRLLREYQAEAQRLNKFLYAVVKS